MESGDNGSHLCVATKQSLTGHKNGDSGALKQVRMGISWDNWGCGKEGDGLKW